MNILKSILRGFTTTIYRVTMLATVWFIADQTTSVVYNQTVLLEAIIGAPV